MGDSDNEQPHEQCGHSRKRTVDRSKWNISVAKEKRNHGDEYTSVKMKRVMAARQLGPACRCGCFTKVGIDKVNEIFSNFWAMGDYNAQNGYINRLVKHVDVKESRVKGRLSRRSRSVKYSVMYGDAVFSVCAVAFRNIHGISEKRVRTVLGKVNQTGNTDSDQRGKQRKTRGISEDIRNKVIEHIKSLPALSSHYSRAKSPHKYPSSDLNINKLFVMYCDWLQEHYHEEQPVKQSYYRQIFNSFFNLGFTPPMADTCNYCDKTHELKAVHPDCDAEKIRTLTVEKRLQEIQAKVARTSQKKFTINQDPTVAAIAIDLQQTLPMTTCWIINPPSNPLHCHHTHNTFPGHNLKMDEDERKVDLKEENLDIKSEIKEEIDERNTYGEEICEEGFSHKWQSEEVKDELIEDITVKEEASDFSYCKQNIKNDQIKDELMKDIVATEDTINFIDCGPSIKEHSSQNSGTKSDFGKNNSFNADKQMEHLSTSARNVSSLTGFENNETHDDEAKRKAMAAMPVEVSQVSVTKIQQLNFSQLSLQEKIGIKREGRPTLEIQISQPGISNNKKYIRSFNPEWYQKKSWLCGCEVKNALFCFPCLLLGGDLTWTKNGFTNINKMKEKTEKHECSKKHIDNVISLSLLGTVNIEEKLSEAYRLSIIDHNKKVTKNREILSKIIDCIKFCGNFEISLCGHDEKKDSENPGVFRGLINFAAKLDPDLKNHLESNTVFKGISKIIQNDILNCLLQICRDQIKKEIKEASFVAIMADDTTDVSEYTQMFIVLRYELNGEIFERFWGFFTPENQTADGISMCILVQLNILLEEDTQKLIAQTFDGANVMKGKKGGVQVKIKEIYNNAHFIHCYAHQLNLIMKSAASTTRNSRIFFSNLLAIATFFSRSPQRFSVLNKHMNNQIPHPSFTRWNFNIRTVNCVYENFESLKKCIEEIQSTSNADQTISEATGILHILNNETFVFWLNLFHQIMPHVEVIYNQMQSRQIDAFKVQEYIATFKTAILKIRNSKYCENPSRTLMTEAKEVCDCVCVDIKERYSFTNQLVAAKLFNKENFASFNKKMPLEEVTVTIEAYPMIEKEKLLTELQVFYSRPDMHNYGNLINLLKFITENNLADVLCELTKLIKILLTIPMTTSEPERCHSMLKRIKTFLRSTMNQKRLNALAMISMEKSIINNTPNFNEKVINLFAQNKNRRMDFIFK